MYFAQVLVHGIVNALAIVHLIPTQRHLTGSQEEWTPMASAYFGLHGWFGLPSHSTQGNDMLRLPLEAALIITLVVPPLAAQVDAEATRRNVKEALSHLTQLESFRCRVDYEWLVDPRVTPRARPEAPPPKDWAEHVYARGVHVWCKVVADHENAARLRAKIEAVEDELARVRTRPNDAPRVVELEAKLAPLRLGLRDLCGDRVELQDVRSWAWRRGGDWVSMRAPEAGHFPDPKFLAEVLLKLLPACEWSASVGTFEQRPVTVFELRAAGAAARTLVDSGAVTDLGLRGRRSADSTEFRIGMWSRQTTGSRTAFDGWLKFRLEVDPPTKLPARIVVDVRSDFVSSAVADLAAESPSSRVVMNLRLPGHAKATEDDRRD